MTYRVTIQPSGHVFTMEDDETVLDAALRHGFALPYGCRNGGCGSCKGRILQGEVHYDGDLPPALTEEEDESGWALFCSALPLEDLEIEIEEIGAVADIPIKTLPCRVAKAERAGHDVMRLFLKLPASERLQFLAGQYVDIILKDGTRRGFSLANAPHDDEYLELHVRYVEGGRFTSWVFHEMKDKALLRIQGPLGSFFLREESDRPIILVGGGTGFGPLKGIIEHAFAEKMTRPMHLFWGAQTRRDLYMTELPERWAGEHEHFRYTPVLSQPAADDHWTGETGWVHEAVLRSYPDLSDYEVYAAGPPAMIQAIQETFPAQGLSLEHLFYDSFDYAHS